MMWQGNQPQGTHTEGFVGVPSESKMWGVPRWRECEGVSGVKMVHLLMHAMFEVVQGRFRSIYL